LTISVAGVDYAGSVIGSPSNPTPTPSPGEGSGTNPGGGFSPGEGRGTYSFTANGAALSGTHGFASGYQYTSTSSYQVSLSGGTDNTSYSVDFTLYGNGVGTYTVGGSGEAGTAYATYSNDTQYFTAAEGATGTVTISSIANGTMQGTFSFRLPASDGSGATVEVANGTFSVPSIDYLGDISTASGSYNYTVNGAGVSGTEGYAGIYAYDVSAGSDYVNYVYLTTNSENGTSRYISVAFRGGVGTYPVGSEYDNEAQAGVYYHEADPNGQTAGYYYSYAGDATGSVTITSITGGFMEGTFSFRLLGVTNLNLDTAGTAEIVNGTFRVPLVAKPSGT
jgi:hypothetical protein